MNSHEQDFLKRRYRGVKWGGLHLPTHSQRCSPTYPCYTSPVHRIPPIESHHSAEKGLYKGEHTICIDGIQAEKALPPVREVTVKGPLKLGYQALQCPESRPHITITTRGSQKTPHFKSTQ